jgi:altronate hydrolase
MWSASLLRWGQVQALCFLPPDWVRPPATPVAPVVKISTNSNLAQRMPDIVDFDTGPIIDGEVTIEQMGEAILDRVIEVASGKVRTKAEILGQNDFIPWKRGVSL